MAVWGLRGLGCEVKADGTCASSSGLSQLNILGSDPQHGGDCHPRINPVSHQRLGPRPTSPFRAIGDNNPPKSSQKYLKFSD